MLNRGFTLFELLIALAVTSILLIVGLPNLSSQLHNTKFKTSTQQLFDAVQLARTKAVFGNKRVTIRNLGHWEDGWEVFVDSNDDGERNNDELLIQTQTKMPGVQAFTSSPTSEYISFISNGQGRKAGPHNGGALLLGYISLCPQQPGAGYKFILSSGGRMRIADLSVEQCQELQQPPN